MLSLRPLHADNASDMADLQGVLEDAPAYSNLVKGRPPLPTDAEDIFNEFPPGLHAADKLVAGFMFNNQMVGVVDICKNYPDVHMAYIGLLLFAEKFQGHGFGSDALNHIRALVRSWNCRTIRVAVIETNVRALTFWKNEGFIQLYRKATKEYTGDGIVMESVLYPFK
jgi:GNAT superfamily N-acetyltransferase